MKSASVQGGHYVAVTNTGMPALTLEQLHGMTDEEFGYRLQGWHGGGRDPLYAIASSLSAGHLDILGKPELVQGAVKSLAEIFNSHDSTYGDRIETMAMADELNHRSQKYSEGKTMNNKTDKIAEKWVLANCKFAAAGPQGQMALEMAKKLLPMSRMAPIAAPDVMRAINQGSAGLAMPPGGDMDSFVESVLDGVEGLGGRVARAPAQQQGVGTPFNSNPGNPHEDPAFQQFRQQRNRA